MEKQVVDANRLRRITGYLTTDVKQWNNAKQAEERDRVKHTYNERLIESCTEDTFYELSNNKGE